MEVVSPLVFAISLWLYYELVLVSRSRKPTPSLTGDFNRQSSSSSIVIAGLTSTIIAFTPMNSYAQSVDTSGTAAWVVVGIDGKPYQNSLSSQSCSESGRNVLEWKIARAKVVAALATPIATSNLKSVEFDIWSKNNSVAAVQLEDLDKARFHAPVILQGGMWKHVVLQPRDFKINDDSPVKKRGLQPEKLGNVLTFVELGSILNAKDDNVLRLDNVSVTRDKPKGSVSIPSIINGPKAISANLVVDRPVEIRPGGKLIITSPQATLMSSVTIDGGSLIISGTRVSGEGRMPHDLTIKVKNGGRFVMNNAVWQSSHMSSLNLENKSRAEFENVRFVGSGFTVELLTGNNVSLKKVEDMGEFVISPGAKLTAANSRGLLFWLIFNKDNPTAIAFPGESSVKAWSAPSASKFDMTIADCRNTMWALVSDSGSNVQLKRTRLRAVGLLFTNPGSYTVSAIKNKSSSDFPSNLNDRRVDLGGSTVESWNFYPSINARLTLDHCTFGELIAFGNAEALVKDSICDGTGGYIGSRHSSKVRLHQSAFRCPLISFDQSKMTLDSCRVNGPVSASGQSEMTITGSVLSTSPRRLDKARIDSRSSMPKDTR